MSDHEHSTQRPITTVELQQRRVERELALQLGYVTGEGGKWYPPPGQSWTTVEVETGQQVPRMVYLKLTGGAKDAIKRGRRQNNLVFDVNGVETSQARQDELERRTEVRRSLAVDDRSVQPHAARVRMVADLETKKRKRTRSGED
jgi:hypothetical protein